MQDMSSQYAGGAVTAACPGSRKRCRPAPCPPGALSRCRLLAWGAWSVRAVGKVGGVDGVSAVSSRVWTIPNALSFFRLALTPVFLGFVITGEDALALVVLVVSSVTDFLDGWLARRLGQVSRLGQLLDPAADRLYIFAAAIGLAWREVLPWWLVAVIVARDVMLLALGVVLANHGLGPLPVNRLGKMATFCLFWALPLLMLGEAFDSLTPFSLPVGWAFALAGAFLYWWAGLSYVREAVRVIRSFSAPQADDRTRRSDTLDHEEVDGA